MNKKLIIDLTRLSEGYMRTTVRELKVVIEDYCLKNAICGCVNIMEEK